MESALREALAELLAPAEAEAALARAFRLADLTRVPDEVERLDWFVSTPLAHVVDDVLGRGAGALLARRLASRLSSPPGPFDAAPESGPRPRTPPPGVDREPALEANAAVPHARPAGAAVAAPSRSPTASPRDAGPRGPRRAREQGVTRAHAYRRGLAHGAFGLFAVLAGALAALAWWSG